jgi:hypothetical protein
MRCAITQQTAQKDGKPMNQQNKQTTDKPLCPSAHQSKNFPPCRLLHFIIAMRQFATAPAMQSPLMILMDGDQRVSRIKHKQILDIQI